MLLYLSFGGGFALMAMTAGQRRPDAALWYSALCVLIAFVGLRHNVGMDWNNYLRMIAKISWLQNLGDFWVVSEPLYALFLWVGIESGGGIYVTNLITTTIFAVGLFRMAARMPEPWLALMASVPFLIVVVAMSANRQAAACGVIFWLIAYWDRRSFGARVALVILAAGFHTSALIMLIFVGFATQWRLWIKIVLSVLLIGVMVYLLQITGRAEYYDRLYGTGQTELTQSSGAMIHVAMVALPGMVVMLRRRWRETLLPINLYRQMAVISIVTLFMVPIASAASGRIALYWYPVSLMVWSSLPSIVPPKDRYLIRYGIVLLMLGQMFLWLTFANSSHAHFPYRNALFMPQSELEIGYVP